MPVGPALLFALELVFYIALFIAAYVLFGGFSPFLFGLFVL